MTAFARAATAVAISVGSVGHARELRDVSFPKRTIHVGSRAIEAEIADTPDARERGLMFRTKLQDNHGMLFVFDREFPLSFWMKNTLIPLSIGFFDDGKRLIDVQEMSPAATGDLAPPSYRSAKPAMYALEMPKGWFKSKGVKLGARLRDGRDSK